MNSSLFLKWYSAPVFIVILTLILLYCQFFASGLISSAALFLRAACVKFTFDNKIEAMHERSLVSIKVEPRSTSRLSSAFFIFFFLVILVMKIYVRTQKRVSGNQPLVSSSLHFIVADNCETLWNKQRARNLFNSASFFQLKLPGALMLP